MADVTRITSLIKHIRSENASLRRLYKSTGKTRATTNAIEWHESRLDTFITMLIFADASDDIRRIGHRLVGLLQEEDQLLCRINESKKAGFQRPELNIRLAAIRSKVREETALVGHRQGHRDPSADASLASPS